MDSIKLKAFQYGISPTAIVQNPVNVLKKYSPKIVITEGAPSYLTLWILLFLRAIFRYKLVVWSHGVKYQDLGTPFRTLRGRIQLWIFNKADSVLIYTEQRADIVKKYINTPSKVFVAHNTLDTDYLGTYLTKFKITGKEILKEEVGFKQKHNLIYIGRILKTKGLDDLLTAYDILKQEFDLALHIIGNGPEMDKLKKRAYNHSGVKIYGAIYGIEETGKLLYASDLMIMPGYVGLSVVHAFSYGCPVITYGGESKDSPRHSPEVEYITDNENGIFCEPDPLNLASAIRMILSDPQKRRQMSDRAEETAYTKASVSNMLSGFREVISYLKNSL